MLEIKQVDKYYNPGSVNEMCLFQDFSLRIEKGDFVSVIGSNGSGKTSLLNLICGSIRPDAGRIFLDGKDITRLKEHRRYSRIGRVFQDPSLGTCPSMTLFENMSMADNKNRAWNLLPGLNHKRMSFYREQLAALGLGLEDKMNDRVESLSGGQRQCVALLMAMLTPVDYVILDEHTAALDPKTADVVMQLTGRLVQEKKVTALMVTHNLRYALEYGNRLLMMHEGQVIMDKRGKEKEQLHLDDLLEKFYAISIEVGN